MDECVVGQVVPVGQTNAISFSAERLDVPFGNLGIEVLHDGAPGGIKLVARLSDEIIVFRCLCVAEVCRLILDVLPYRC
jgi:hypothetical protein